MTFEIKDFDIKPFGRTDTCENWEYSDEFDRVKSYHQLLSLLNDLRIEKIIPNNKMCVNISIDSVTRTLTVILRLDEEYEFYYNAKIGAVEVYAV